MSVHDTNAVCNIVTKLRAMVRLGIKMPHDDSTLLCPDLITVWE